MKITLLNDLCCPIDKQDLDISIFVKNETGDILEGILTCKTCNRYYPIIYGIPIMSPDEYRQKALEEPILKKWGLELENNSIDTFLLLPINDSD